MQTRSRNLRRHGLVILIFCLGLNALFQIWGLVVRLV